MKKTLEEEITACARAHGDLARLYERHKNVRGAAELRRVENLLWALRRDEPWSTVLPGDPSSSCLGCGADDIVPSEHEACADAREAWIDAHSDTSRDPEM